MEGGRGRMEEEDGDGRLYDSRGLNDVMMHISLGVTVFRVMVEVGAKITELGISRL